MVKGHAVSAAVAVGEVEVRGRGERAPPLDEKPAAMRRDSPSVRPLHERGCSRGTAPNGRGSDEMKTVTWVLLATSLAIGWGCARSDWIQRTLVTSDVTGVWEGVTFGGGSLTWEVHLVLQQEGAKV